MSNRENLTAAEKGEIEAAMSSLVDLGGYVDSFMGNWDYGNKLDSYSFRNLRDQLEDCVAKMEAIESLSVSILERDNA